MNTSPEECKTPQSALSVAQLIKFAEQAFEQFSPGIAAKYYEDAIKQQPNNALLHHKLALMYVEHGEPLQAHKSFLKSIQLSPNENESNYLYIGQQCYGNAAKSAFEKGIELMKNKILKNENHKTDNKITSSLKYEISSVYVSIAELYMTDLCGDKGADVTCEQYLNLSLQFDMDNIETYATFAELRHCQQNTVDAIKYFNVSIKKLFLNKDSEHKMDDDKLDIFCEKSLSIDSFLKIVKLGIELQQYEKCIVILRSLVNANDAIGECWALGSFCFYKLDKKKEAAVWFNNAQSILLMESTNTLNMKLKETLEAIQTEMDIDDLPDLTKLNIDIYGDDDGDNDVNAFLEDEEDAFEEVDLIQDNNDVYDEDIDLNNNDH